MTLMIIIITTTIMTIIQQAANFASTTSCTYTHVSRPFLGVKSGLWSFSVSSDSQTFWWLLELRNYYLLRSLRRWQRRAMCATLAQAFLLDNLEICYLSDICYLFDIYWPGSDIYLIFIKFGPEFETFSISIKSIDNLNCCCVAFWLEWKVSLLKEFDHILLSCLTKFSAVSGPSQYLHKRRNCG